MKKKLELKKKTISVLSERDLQVMEGGEESGGNLTTSFGSCTGFLCCQNTSVITWTIELTSGL